MDEAPWKQSRWEAPASARVAPTACTTRGRLQERQERHGAHDTLAAAAVVLFLLVAALRVEKQLCLYETATHALLALLVLVLLLGQGSASYHAWRNVVVVSACPASPVHHAHMDCAAGSWRGAL